MKTDGPAWCRDGEADRRVTLVALAPSDLEAAANATEIAEAVFRRVFRDIPVGHRDRLSRPVRGVAENSAKSFIARQGQPFMSSAPLRIDAISTSLVTARRDTEGLPLYPGALPETLEEAYAVQARASQLWGDAIAGWKVGRILGDLATRHGADRFIGPIFATSVEICESGTVGRFPAIAGGTAALEAELVAVLGETLAPNRNDWTAGDVTSLLSGVHIGIEVAGCPVGNVGNFGPLASIAVFGNNLGLIVGQAIADWENVDLNGVCCTASIDNEEVATAIAGALPGGPLTATAFALNQAAKLGITLPSGTLISTGAITGMHPVTIGQTCVADFGELGIIRCRVVDAKR
jgi:2-keto-4-pentenoate hydratase